MRDESGFDGWRRVLRIRRVRRDLDEELAFHFMETVEELMAGGRRQLLPDIAWGSPLHGGVVLLIGAGLFVRSLHRVENVDLGFDARHLLYMRPTAASYSMADADRATFFELVRERISRLPDVRGVASAELVPFRGSMATTIRAEGLDSIPPSPNGRPAIDKVSPEYFRVMGLDVRRGRGFEAPDRKLAIRAY